MCEGSAYVVEGSSEKLVMDEVVSLFLKEGSLVLVNEMGEKRKFDSFREVRVDMVRHLIKIVI